MPFVIATQLKTPVIQGGSPNPAGQAVAWYFCGLGKWTRDIGKAKRFNDDDAATQFVLLKDTLPNQKFTFIVVDQLPIGIELAMMDPSEIDRLRRLAKEFRRQKAIGIGFVDLPAPHEPRIYKIGEKQCQCSLCVDRVLNLFQEIK